MRTVKYTTSTLGRESTSLAISLGEPILFVIRGLQAYRGNWSGRCTTIGPEDELMVKDELDQITGKSDSLSLCINAFGGSSTSAFNMGRLLRARFRHITAYIPHVAASAATFFGLCADRLFISECGYMTMVDPMIQFGPQLLQASKILDGSSREGDRWTPEQLLIARSSMQMIEEQLAHILRAAGYRKAGVSSVKARLLLHQGFHDMPISRDDLRAAGVRVASNRACDSNSALRGMEVILRHLVGSKLDGFVRACDSI